MSRRRFNFWETAHRVGLHKNWVELREKIPYLRRAINLIKAREFNNPKALDIGCSTGRYSFILAKEHFSVVGIDVSKTAIDIAKAEARRQKITNVKFLVSDFLKYDAKQKFDLVLDFSVFTHISKQNWNKYLGKIKTHLKRSGFLLVSLWSYNSRRVYDTDLDFSNGRGIILKTKAGDFYNYFFSEDEIKTLFSKFFKIYWIEEKELKSLERIQPSSNLNMFFVLCSPL